MIRPTNRIELLKLLPKHLTWCEVGVLRGEFSQAILNQCQPHHLHLVDPWCGPYPWHDDKLKIDEMTYGLDNLRETTSRFMGRHEVSIWRTTSAEWWQRTPCLDAIYIDGGHDYATVAIDLEGALRAIRKQARNVSGWILGHDYCEGGVMSGVRRAVDEFCEEHRLELWALTDEPLAAVHRVSEADKLRPEEVAYNSFAIEVRR